jgi:general secretion pathway protein C
LQIAPVHFNGEVAGVRLQGFSPESLPSMAGLQNGDIVTSINGVPITTPARGLKAYEASRAAGAVVMEVVRGAQRVILVVSLPPA